MAKVYGELTICQENLPGLVIIFTATLRCVSFHSHSTNEELWGSCKEVKYLTKGSTASTMWSPD